MTNDDYRAVDSIKQNIGSIARLGRAASVHMVLAMQRASGNTISSDLKNNIQSFVMLGNFGSSESTLVFDKDISHLSKPIMGRAFMLDANRIAEVQTYWIKPHLDFEFDENLKLTYINPYFKEKKAHFKEEIDDTGWYEESDKVVTKEDYKEQKVEDRLSEDDVSSDLEKHENEVSFLDVENEFEDDLRVDIELEIKKPIKLKLNVKKVSSNEDKT